MTSWLAVPSLLETPTKGSELLPTSTLSAEIRGGQGAMAALSLDPALRRVGALADIQPYSG